MDTDDSDTEIPKPFREYFFSSREQTTKAFDEENWHHLSEVLTSMSKILTMLWMLLLREADLSGVRFDAYALSKTALDTLVSALHLARQRANIEVGCLLRSALESGCTALHISQDAKAHESYLEQTYHSTRSIAFAKKHIPVVGELWGALSQATVHIQRRGHGPKWERDQDDEEPVATVDFSTDVRPGEPIQDQASLTLISLIAEIVARTQELSLLDEDPSRPGWRRVPGTSAIFGSGTEAAIAERYQQFLSLKESARKS